MRFVAAYLLAVLGKNLKILPNTLLFNLDLSICETFFYQQGFSLNGQVYFKLLMLVVGTFVIWSRGIIAPLFLSNFCSPVVSRCRVWCRSIGYSASELNWTHWLRWGETSYTASTGLGCRRCWRTMEQQSLHSKLGSFHWLALIIWNKSYHYV